MNDLNEVWVLWSVKDDVTNVLRVYVDQDRGKQDLELLQVANTETVYELEPIPIYR